MANYGKPDYWSLKAQKEGYPARSVYKLKEMDEKFGLLKKAPSPTAKAIGGAVLDLGAAPGSWSLYVLRKFADSKSSGVSLCAVDLSPLSRQYDKGLFDGDNFHFIQGDITTVETRSAIQKQGPYNLIISDAAPATTGNRSVDTARSLELAEAVLSYAESSLVQGGSLVIKVFQGGDTTEILKRIKEIFKTGKSFKPEACRNESFETYYIGSGKKT
jgi:23S rRNA (uridine2552-2'-O)-methyltransferase